MSPTNMSSNKGEASLSWLSRAKLYVELNWLEGVIGPQPGWALFGLTFLAAAAILYVTFFGVAG